MPELDYLVLAEYARQDGAGFTHIMCAGLDTFTVPEENLPAAAPVSSRDEIGAEHEFSLTFQGPGGEVFRATQRFQTPPPPPGVPEQWRTALSVVIRTALPIPSYGHYLLRATIDDDPRWSRSLDVRVISPGQS
jgi:hypothetical protein